MKGSKGKPRYTVAQREAIFRLKLERHADRQVCDILAQGYGLLEPFEIPHQTVSRIFKEMVERRGGIDGRELARAAPLDAVDAMVKELVTLAQRRLERLIKKSHANQLATGEIREMARCLRDLRNEAAKVKPHVPKKNGAKPGDDLAWLETEADPTLDVEAQTGDRRVSEGSQAVAGADAPNLGTSDDDRISANDPMHKGP